MKKRQKDKIEEEPVELDKLPRSMITVDCAVFIYEERELQVLLIYKTKGPEKNLWALPGGIVLENENLNIAAHRVLFEWTGIDRIYLEQLYTFGDPDRYPLARIITVAYYSLVRRSDIDLNFDSEKGQVKWFNVSSLPSLAFDHDKIIQASIQHLKDKINHYPLMVLDLLPDKFNLPDIHNLFEFLMEKKLERRNFRKKLLSLDILVKLDEKQKNVAHKAAWYYTVNKEKLEKAGIYELHFSLF